MDKADLAYFKVNERCPEVCGTGEKRVVVEIRRKKQKTAITFWYEWDYDLYPNDHVDWEPVSLVYFNEELLEIYARVHDALVRFYPTDRAKKVRVYFISFGHTPVVKVENKSSDVHLFKLNDGMDSIREKWLNLCYQRAESSGWTLVKQQPALETNEGPILDIQNWKAWGKHSVYLRI